jgi:hypothetical protein
LKRIEAQQKREERTAKKRQRELEKMLKEQAKLSAQEQARLEVEAFENKLDVLLSVHREVSSGVDWMGLLVALPPFKRASADSDAYQEEWSSWQRMRLLAKKVLEGDPTAYAEALAEMSSFGELASLGESIAFRVESRSIIDCELRVSGRDVIPADVKSLTTSGKLTSKPMPKARFHELYQDYVCGCVLRVARETFSLLPVDTVIVTATVAALQVSTGMEVEIPVLSAAIPREVVNRLDFERLDPSDSMENFVHRGDVMASKKTGEFVPIEPLKNGDLTGVPTSGLPCDSLWARVKDLRSRIRLAVKSSSSDTTQLAASV